MMSLYTFHLKLIDPEVNVIGLLRIVVYYNVCTDTEKIQSSSDEINMEGGQGHRKIKTKI